MQKFSVLIILTVLIVLIDCQRSNNRIARKEFKWIDDEDKPWVWGTADELQNPHESNEPQKSQQPWNTKINKQCGTAPAVNTSGRIVGGREAYIGEFPWQVAITRKVYSGYVFHCGGAILNDHWIVTASHCIILDEKVRLQPSDLKISIGTHRLSDVHPRDEYTIDKIRTHENYHVGSGGELVNDIALLHIPNAIDFSSNLVNTVCLPTPGEIFVRNLFVSGWGRTEEKGLKSDILKTVEVFVHSNNDCKRSLKEIFFPKEMFCAGLKKGGADSCAGDSGGAIVKRRRGQAYLAGIVSFGIGCARKGISGIYTRVPTYVHWIQKYIE